MDHKRARSSSSIDGGSKNGLTHCILCCTMYYCLVVAQTVIYYYNRRAFSRRSVGGRKFPLAAHAGWLADWLARWLAHDGFDGLKSRSPYLLYGRAVNAVSTSTSAAARALARVALRTRVRSRWLLTYEVTGRRNNALIHYYVWLYHYGNHTLHSTAATEGFRVAFFCQKQSR